jgi:DNA-binding response OmpR family regulator
MITILIAEDDPAIRQGLADLLTAEGYRAITAENGMIAWETFLRELPDLIILDIMMPEMNGYQVCQRIRDHNSTTPILFLTAKTEEEDQVAGFRAGGDDFVTKPFGMQALLARIEAMLRRASPAIESSSSITLPESFPFGVGTVYRKRFEFVRDGQALPLTSRELSLIELFSQHPREALSREMLLQKVWGLRYHGSTRTLDQHIAQLRKKIEPHGQPHYLITVHGVGYSYDPEAEKNP